LLGCALYLAWRVAVADSRKALAGTCFFTIAVIVAACLQAPDALIVSGFGGLIISLAQVSKAGSARFSHPLLVYLGEISYSVYMVCIPWEVLFVNVAVKIGHFDGKQLPPMLWLVFLVTLVPLAAAGHHLIEKPARRRMKLWRGSRPPHNFATAAVR
jgi:peptidoglycan/LPS O-acetylase OafA/YrhL